METLHQIPTSAAALDVKQPGWHREINLETLNIAHAHNCILGQLDGNYMTSHACGLGYRIMQYTRLNFAELGFTAWDWAIDGTRERLNTAWRTEVLNRLHEDALIEDMTRDAQKAKANLVKVDTDTPEPALV